MQNCSSNLNVENSNYRYVLNFSIFGKLTNRNMFRLFSKYKKFETFIFRIFKNGNLRNINKKYISEVNCFEFSKVYIFIIKIHI